jgi:hypothetical protein
MSGGELKIEVLPSGSVVPAFGLMDAVSKGTLDGGHGVVAYWYGKQAAMALWGSGAAWGMDANMLLAWHKYGGGKELLEEIYKGLNLDVVSFLYGPMPTQPLGLVQEADHQDVGLQGTQVPHRGPFDRHLHGDGGRGERVARRGNCSRRWTGASSTARNSTMRPPTSSSASRTCPRSAC